MASLVILSSSPPQPQQYRNTCSSSPILPSPSSLFGAQPSSKIEEGKPSYVSGKANKGFTSAARLLQLGRLECRPDAVKSRGDESTSRKDYDDETGATLEQKEPNKGNGKLERPGKVLARDLMKCNEATNLKYIERPDQQAKIGGSKITKSNIKTLNLNKVASVRVQTARTVPQQSKRRAREAQDKDLEPCEDLMLDRAIRRRTAWTPPKETPHTADSYLPTPSPSDSKNADGENGQEKPLVFDDLLSNFGYGSPHITVPRDSVKHSAVTGISQKRKETEPVEPPKLKKPRKSRQVQGPKAPKRKPTTITGQATALYAPKNVPDPDSTLVKYLERQTKAGNSDEAASILKVAVAKHTTSRELQLGQKTMRGAAQRDRPAATLLSPDSALKKLDAIDLVFGTSSQLIREKSPSVVRDPKTATAIRNTWTVEDQFENIECFEFCGRKPGATLMFRASKSLWSAATRDPTGSLTSIEPVDLVDSPAISKAFAESNASKMNTKSAKQLELNPNSTEERAQISGKGLPAGSGCPNFGGYTTIQLAQQIAKFGFKPIKSRKAQIEMLERCWEGQQRTALAALEANGNLNAATTDTTILDRQLTQKRAKNDGKTAASSKATMKDNTELSAMTGGAPKRPRGRPRKDVSAESLSPKKAIATLKSTPTKSKRKGVLVEEISDSDTPTTPLLHGKSTPHSSPSLELLSSTADSESPELDTAQKREHCFNSITKAVITFPPTHDIKNPTWHEKILMYDPVVLEDMAAWLNTEGLARVGFDDEVHAVDVRAWCESRSICCIWKANLRGGTRSRY